MLTLTHLPTVSSLPQPITQNNHLVYENIGSLATRVTHIHVAIPLNISHLEEHINLFIHHLLPLLNLPKSAIINPDPQHPSRQRIDKLTAIIAGIAKLTVDSLESLMAKVKFISNILPQDDAQDVRPPRQSRNVQVWDIANRNSKLQTLSSDLLNNFQSFDSTEMAHLRHKRQLFIAAALVMGLVGTFFGLFNQAEIHKISDHVSKLESTTNMLVHIAETHERHINQLVTDLSTLTNTIEIFLEYNPTLLLSKLNRQVNTIEGRVDSLEHTFQQLQTHRLSTKLLSHPQLLALHHEVQTLAAKTDTIPIPRNLHDYFQLETSYLRSNNQIIILLHVPCSSEQSLFTIFRYIPFPFPVAPSTTADPSTSLSTIQDLINLEHVNPNYVQEGLVIKADTDMIAIGKNKQGKHQYVVLSDTDLEACYHRSHNYICEKQQVIRSDMSGSCLGALFIQNPEGIEENCRIERKQLRETVYRLSATEHLVFSPNPLITQIECKNGSHFPLRLKATSRISIPEGCSAQLHNHTIYSDPTLRIAPEALHFTWDFNPANLPNSAQLLEGTKHIGPQLAMIRKHLDQLANETIAKEVFAGLLVEHLTSPNSISILIWVILIVLAAALIYAGVQWYRARSQAIRLARQQQGHAFGYTAPTAPPTIIRNRLF